MAAGRHFFRRSASGHNQTRGPIWTSDTSKRVVWTKDVPLGFRNINFIVFTPKIPQNPNFWAISMHFLWKTKMLITFEP
jgi:hypothetical protein